MDGHQSMVEEALRPIKTQITSSNYAIVVSRMKGAISACIPDIEMLKASFFDDAAFTENLIKALREEIDSPLDLKKMRIASLVCIAVLMRNNASPMFVAKVRETFTIEKLRELFRGVQDFVGLDYPGNNEKWAVLRNFAEGMCYIRAAVGDKLGKDIVITAVGYFVGHVHSCSGNNPGKMALCYEYIYRCIGQQEYKPKSRASKSGDLNDLDSKARTEMVQKLPDLMHAFKPHVDECLALLEKLDAEQPKKRKSERESVDTMPVKLSRAPSTEHEVGLILIQDLSSAGSTRSSQFEPTPSDPPTNTELTTHDSSTYESTECFPYYPSHHSPSFYPATRYNLSSSYNDLLYAAQHHNDSEDDGGEAFPTHPGKKPLSIIDTKSHKSKATVKQISR